MRSPATAALAWIVALAGCAGVADDETTELQDSGFGSAGAASSVTGAGPGDGDGEGDGDGGDSPGDGAPGDGGGVDDGPSDEDDDGGSDGAAESGGPGNDDDADDDDDAGSDAPGDGDDDPSGASSDDGGAGESDGAGEGESDEDDGPPIPAFGDCCEPHADPGCDQPTCQADVCGTDSFCCDMAWDTVCVLAAFESDDCLCETGPGEIEVFAISELRYDDPGADDNVFVEIAGPPGTSLDDVVLEAIDGATGDVYATLALSGTMPEDGLYVVVHTTANDADLLAVADRLDDFADLDNSPDNLRIRVAGVIVDAVGYGDFGPGDTFAGESLPAPDVSGIGSLARVGSTVDIDNNALDFVITAPPTPGELN